MQLTGHRQHLTVYPSFVLLICILIWLDEGTAVLSFLMSSALHESGHLFAAYLLKITIYGMELRATGAILHTGTASRGKELLCTAAGPLINGVLLCVCFHRWPQTALINLLLLIYNLLPIYPLDGGRMLQIILSIVINETAAERICAVVARLLTAAVVVSGVLLTCVFHAGLYPCLIASLFLCRLRNTPCKMGKIQLK